MEQMFGKSASAARQPAVVKTVPMTSMSPVAFAVQAYASAASSAATASDANSASSATNSATSSATSDNASAPSQSNGST
jgi:hypothetical protein